MDGRFLACRTSLGGQTCVADLLADHRLGCAAGPELCQGGRAQVDGSDGGPVPVALGAVLNHEAYSADLDLAGGQLHAQGGDDRLGGLLGCALAERDVGRPRRFIPGHRAGDGCRGRDGSCLDRSQVSCGRHSEHDRFGMVEDLAEAGSDRTNVG